MEVGEKMGSKKSEDFNHAQVLRLWKNNENTGMSTVTSLLRCNPGLSPASSSSSPLPRGGRADAGAGRVAQRG
jgi:hypothetical protein